MSEPLSRIREDALESLLNRARGTAEQLDVGWPHVAASDDATWLTTPDGDWTGGFFVGQLWLDAIGTRHPQRMDVARRWASRIAPRASSATIFRGFLFWYGVAIGARATGDPNLRDVALAGAHALSNDYNASAGLIPLGPAAEEATTVGPGETNIDGVPGTILLLAWAAAATGDSSLRTMAISHAARHVELCLRGDGGVIQSASFDPVSGRVLRRYTHKGLRGDTVWARAQAWGMLGFAQAMRLERDRFADAACAAADWWLERLPSDGIAPWDFDDADPAAPIDTSATAIAAVALLELADRLPRPAERYRQTAVRMVDGLVRDHVTPTGAAGGQPAGRLLHGCYNRRLGLATDHELIWGNYYLTEALARLTGRLEKNQD